MIIPGILCGGSAWAMSVNTGSDQIVAAAQQHKTDLVFALVTPHVPAVLVQIGYVLFLTSVFAALLAFHAAVARYQFALGREGILPGAWGRTHPRTGAPTLGSITQSLLALGVLIAYNAGRADPLVYLFAWLTVLGGLGVLILMWAASAAVLAFFMRNRRLENAWRGQIAPAFAFLLLTGVLAATLIGLPDMLQVTPDSPLRWLIPPAYGVIALLGLCWGLITRATRPEVYAAIGRGTDVRLLIPISPTPRGLYTEPVEARRPLSFTHSSK